MEALEYITKDALMMCNQGGAPDFFSPTYNTHIKIHGLLVATNMDGAPLVNIPSFKVCKITKGPCAPATAPLTWKKTFDIKVKGINTLVGESTCPCNVGGTIEFLTSGQVPLPPEAQAEVDALKDQAQRTLDDAGHGDSVGETGFAEGMIPVWGSGRDFVNDFQTGDGWGMAMNGGFLVWDAASVVAGVFSFGAGTALMQGAKAGVKGVASGAAKALSREALQQLGKSVFKHLTKEALEASLKRNMAKLGLKVVTGCFTGETLIHTKNGLKKIKNINIGDEVYSYDIEKGKTILQKVVSLYSEDVEELLEITTENEIIKTTKNHPFYVNGAYKDAEQIVIEDYLFLKNNRKVKVIGLNYVENKAKVFNFEVEVNHCYFVGKDGILVHNICYKKVFFDAFPHLKGKVVVHHAVEQQVLKKWPGLFDEAFMHSLNNLRGIPKNLNNSLHLSKIRIEWNKFYRAFDNAGKIPTRQQVLNYAGAIDKKFGNLFDPPF